VESNSNSADGADHEAVISTTHNGRFRRIYALIGLVALASASVTAAVVLESGNSIAPSSATSPLFVDGGDYPSVTTYNAGKITISAPPSGSDAQFTASPQGVYDSFESTSPAAPVARAVGYGTATIYRAVYTDEEQGPIDPSTRVVTPTYVNSPVWILIYNNVQWPVGGSPSAVPPPAGGNGKYAASQLSPGLEDVYAIFSPSGSCLGTMVVPAGS